MEMEIVEDIKKVHSDFLKAIEGLTSQQLMVPETIGKWSAKDTMLHTAMWTGECLKGFSIWKTGHDFDWDYAKEYLSFNDFWVKSCAHLTPEQVIQMLNLIYLALINELAGIPPEIWKSRGGVPKWLQGIAIAHARGHSDKLNAYRNKVLHNISI
jgi:hypothetical protein